MSAMAHIQNTAPGPPRLIAMATPATLPVPTRDAAEIEKARNAEMPSSPSGSRSGFSTIERSMSGISLIWMNRDRIV